MTSGFGELSTSMAMRDIIDRMVREAVDRERPRYRYARVTAIDRGAFKCDVVFNGETGAVRVNMGAIQPSRVGQIVRVEGIGVDKFITDVIGQWGAGQQTGTVTGYPTQGPVSVIWDSDGTTISGPYTQVARGYRPRNGDRVVMTQSSGGIMIAPVNPDSTVQGNWLPLPTWYRVVETVGYQNGWIDYPQIKSDSYPPYVDPFLNESNLTSLWVPDWSGARFTRTASGIVKLGGLIRSGTTTRGTLLFTLPPGFRPVQDGIYSIWNSSGWGTVDVMADGRVIARAVASGWTSLENVVFPSADFAPLSAWTTPTLLNSYTAFGGAWATPGYWVDRNGIMWFKGLLNRATLPTGITTIFTMGTYSVDRQTNNRTASQDAGVGVILLNGSSVQRKIGTETTWLSLNGVCTPVVNGWANNNWYYLPLAAGYSNWEASDAVNLFAYPMVVRTPDGLCYSRGTFKSTSVTIDQTFTTLPDGYRPRDGALLLSSVTNDTLWRWNIRTTGAMQTSTGQAAAGSYLSIDNGVWVAEK